MILNRNLFFGITYGASGSEGFIRKCYTTFFKLHKCISWLNSVDHICDAQFIRYTKWMQQGLRTMQTEIAAFIAILKASNSIIIRQIQKYLP